MKPVEEAKPTKYSCQRRSNKPLMEKKRRARINNCLTQLKSLVLEGMKKDGSQYSKLEKADILELTVKHLKNIQAQNTLQTRFPDNATYSRYRAGFSQCANEVLRYVSASPGVKDELKLRLGEHLCRSQVNYDSFIDKAPAHCTPNQPDISNVTQIAAPALSCNHTMNISTVPTLVMYDKQLELQNNGYMCLVPAPMSTADSQPMKHNTYCVNTKTVAPSMDNVATSNRMYSSSTSSVEIIPPSIQAVKRLTSNLVYMDDVTPQYASSFPSHALSDDKVWRPW